MDDWSQDVSDDQEYFEKTLSIMIDRLHDYISNDDHLQAEVTAEQIRSLMTT